jgi:hypothetical protein
MPDTDMTNTLVVGATSGHLRTTKSWVLGRLLRDLDDRLDDEMRHEQAHVPPDAPEEKEPIVLVAPQGGPASQPKAWEALRASVFEVDDEPPCDHGVPTLDWVWFLGFIVILLQLLISIIPWILNNEWATFLIATSGSILALIGASLPQWREEKWACPKKGGATITLTQGNGSRHAVVIKGKRGIGLDLEILAQGTRTSHRSLLIRMATAVLAFL